uniref:F-box domain-containing protein n=1 Tax=Vannella robusta TaxID=1487602 RepID=A0A7S4M7U1_9EUKA|mmetsp:Transcript_1406/g.1793  ORF Transcript_1406/g.1793 Transcript_1406/m.1793 type:complete len:236 (+) Transcript_1406:38-745(+)
MSATKLPDELWMMIMSYLEDRDVASLSQSSKFFWNLTSDQTLWLERFLLQYGKRRLRKYEDSLHIQTLSWKHRTLVEMLRRKLNVLHSRIYKKDVDFGKVRWMKRNIDVCETHIRYSLPDPLRGIYVSQKLKNTQLTRTIKYKRIVKIKETAPTEYSGMILYTFNVYEEPKRLRILPLMVHSFGVTNEQDAQEWRKIIQQHYLAANCWHHLRKQNPMLPKSAHTHSKYLHRSHTD